MKEFKQFIGKEPSGSEKIDNYQDKLKQTLNLYLGSMMRFIDIQTFSETLNDEEWVSLAKIFLKAVKMCIENNSLREQNKE